MDYKTLAECLANVPDPRSRRGRRYEWKYILIVIGAALLAGQRSVRAIAQWAAESRTELLAGLKPEQESVPSAATLHRALRKVSVEGLEKHIGRYTQGLDEGEAKTGAIVQENGEVLRGQAVDGKTLCGASSHGESVHLVSVVRHESGIVLAQEKVAAKRDEREAAQRLLATRPLQGTVTTFDALHTQVKQVEQILEGGGQYLMEVKKNQPQLYEEISLAFQASPAINEEESAFWNFQVWESCAKQHGRLEFYRIESTTALNTHLSWPGLAQVLRRITTCQDLSTGRFSNQVHFGVTSLEPSQVSLSQVEQFWRWHWTIENRVHYPRDVSMGEDACQVHSGHAPQALAALRNAILSLVHYEGWHFLPDAFRHFDKHVQRNLQLLGAFQT